MAGWRIQKIAEYEASLRPTLLTHILRRIGRTRLFAAVYRRIGPGLDRWLMRRSHLIGHIYGLPGLLLTTLGKRSGQPRSSPLLYLREGQSFVVLGTNFGQPHHPAWTANLLAHPEATLSVAGQQVPVYASLVDEAAWGPLFERFAEVYPGYRDYLGRCGDRIPRMFRLEPV